VAYATNYLRRRDHHRCRRMHQWVDALLVSNHVNFFSLNIHQSISGLGRASRASI